MLKCSNIQDKTEELLIILSCIKQHFASSPRFSVHFCENITEIRQFQYVLHSASILFIIVLSRHKCFLQL